MHLEGCFILTHSDLSHFLVPAWYPTLWACHDLFDPSTLGQTCRVFPPSCYSIHAAGPSDILRGVCKNISAGCIPPRETTEPNHMCIFHLDFRLSSSGVSIEEVCCSHPVGCTCPIILHGSEEPAGEQPEVHAKTHPTRRGKPWCTGTPVFNLGGAGRPASPPVQRDQDNCLGAGQRWWNKGTCSSLKFCWA